MKIIRDNFVIVQLKDIRHIGILPVAIIEQLKTFYDINEKYETLIGEKSINFFKDRDYIVDYDFVSKLSESELEEEIKIIEEELEKISKRYLELSNERRLILDRDIDYNTNIKNLKYKLDTLKDYQKNKEKYDCEIKELLKNKTINTQTKKKKRKK